MISKLTFILLAFAVAPLDLQFKVLKGEDGYFYELPKDKHGDRERGEDSFGSTPNLLVLGDGIGGVEFSSKFISQTIVNALLKDSLEHPKDWSKEESLEDFRRRVVTAALNDVNRLYQATGKAYSYEITGYPQGAIQIVPFEAFKSATTMVTAGLVKDKSGNPKLRVFQKGDSRVAIFRLTPAGDGSGSFYKLVFVSREGQKFFNAPFSFVWEPRHKANYQEDAVFDLDVKETDLVIVGSDGLFDNVPAAVLNFVVNYLVRLYQTEDFEVGLKDNTLALFAGKLFQKFASEESKIQGRLAELMAEAGKSKKSGRLRGFAEMKEEMDKEEASKKEKKAQVKKLIEEMRAASGKSRGDAKKSQEKPKKEEASPNDKPKTPAPKPTEKKEEGHEAKHKSKLNPKSKPFFGHEENKPIKIEENLYADTPEDEARHGFLDNVLANYKPSEYKIDLSGSSSKLSGQTPSENLSGETKKVEVDQSSQQVYQSYPQMDQSYPLADPDRVQPPNYDNLYSSTELQEYQGQRSQAVQGYMNWAQDIRSQNPSHREVAASLTQNFVQPMPQEMMMWAQQQEAMNQHMHRLMMEEFILQQADMIQAMRMQQAMGMGVGMQGPFGPGFPGYRRLMEVQEDPAPVDRIASPVMHETEDMPKVLLPSDEDTQDENQEEERTFYTPKSHLSAASPKNLGEVAEEFHSPKAESPSKKRLEFLSTNHVFFTLLDDFLAIDSLKMLDLETPFDLQRTSRPATQTDEEIHEAVLGFFGERFAFSEREIGVFLTRVHADAFCGVIAVFTKLIASNMAYFPSPFYINSIFETDRDFIPAPKDDDISLVLGAVLQAGEVPSTFKTDSEIARLTYSTNQVFQEIPNNVHLFIEGFLEQVIALNALQSRSGQSQRPHRPRIV